MATRTPTRSPRRTLSQRIDALDWSGIERSLGERGYARTPRVLSAAESRQLVSLYGRDERFRSTVEMERHRFGKGQYRYFDRPLPEAVAELRESLYAHLAPIANRWARLLRRDPHYPATLDKFVARCHEQGQKRPTPLLLRYETDGYNCLHQDLYGAVAFPLQVTAFLSRPDTDYGGGEFLLLEQRPRAQSRGEAIRAEQGELVIFPNADRPTQGVRGVVRTTLRHGVSRIAWGERYALGVIFHDAR